MTFAGSSAAVAVTTYLGLVSGRLPLDLGIGRRSRPLGPLAVDIAATPAVVMDVIAQPYLGRPTRAMQEKLQVLERGSDLVLASHFTPIRGRLRAVTVETVRFTGTERVDFRLVRGPVPHVLETFALIPYDGGTRLDYTGEMAADLWQLGEWWAGIVAAKWEATVAATLESVRSEAERRADQRGSA